MPQAPIFSTKRERNDTFIALLVLLLAGYGIYNFTFADRDDDDVIRQTEKPSEVRASMDVFSVSTVLAKDQKRTPQEVPEKLPLQPVTVQTNTPGEVYVPVPVITTEPEVLVAVPVAPTPVTPVERPANEITTTGIIPQDPTTATLAFSRENIATAAEPMPTPADQLSTKSVKPALPLGSCIVIAGSFRSAQNRNVMRRELIKDGYQVTAGELNNGLFYTGIPVGCQDGPTRTRVEKELRTQYKVSPWILKQ